MGDIEVLPGDTIHYALAYSNIGNMIARNVALTDSLSERESFISATGDYAYDAVNRRLRWEFGDLSPQEIPDTVYVTARAQTDLPNSAEILNTAYASADGGIFTQSPFITTNILPISLTLTPNPAVIMGNGMDSSFVTADVRSFLGNPAPDGIPVAFSATEGTISTGYDTVLTENGLAVTHLHSSVVSGQAVISQVTGIARYSATQTAQDVTNVTFLIGAFEGTIMDYNGEPVEGAVVSLLLVSDESVVGTDTTSTDGYYLIPVDHTDDYQVVYTIFDSEGNATITDQPVTIQVPENGEIVPNLNSISGILMDGNTGQVLQEAGVMVILEGSVDSTYFLSKSTTGMAGFIDTTLTNEDGFYFFTNLLPGDYTLRTEYAGSGSFSDDALSLTLGNTGTYVVNANLALTQAQFYTYKRVDKAMAQLGDTLTYRIYYGSALSALPDSVPVWISDDLPEEVEYLPGSLLASNGMSLFSYDSSSYRIVFKRNGIAHNAIDSLVFQTRIRDDLPAGVTFISNEATVYNANDSTLTVADSRSRAITKVVVPYLSVDKRVNKRVAQRGDILTYTVTVQNRSNQDSLTAIDLTDIMPLGFKYKSNTTYCGTDPLGDPLIVQSQRGQQEMIWSLPEILLPGEKCVIKYRAVVGMNAKYGENENYAYATANTPADVRTQSAEDRATVVIKPGFISDVGFIFGKVYFDLNQNGQHDLGEPSAGDVELITETGIRVITDEFGKYSIPNVRPGRHVLRVNRQSLPERTHVILNSADFMGDAISRSVDVSPGGMAKANFALEQEVDMAMIITEVSTLTMTQHPLTTDFRQVVYKPWRTTFRLGFLSGEAKLRPELFSALRKASDFLRWQKQVIIEIDGHTNNIPISDASAYKDNFELSKARAEAIKQFLVDEMGIDAHRITTHGYGPTRPIAANDTEEGKHLNRRVEMIFHNPEEDLPYDQELRFRVDMVKRGSARLTDVTFHEILPAGFTYKPNTASFKGRPLEPIAVTDTKAIWSLGEWIDEENLQSIEFALEPIDHTRIPTISNSKGYISFQNSVGHRDSTTALQTNMITQIEETLLRINMQEANFDLNSAQLRPDAYIELNKLGDFMVWQKDFTITIKGFTDNTGTLDYNMQLSRNRAERVKDYLLDHFPIDRDRIETSFYGPLYPVAGNDTPSGRAKNRRVELLVNSDFQQEFVVKVDASRDSLAYRVLVEHALTDTGMVTQSIALKPGIPAPYLLNLALTDYEDVDSVQVSVSLPAGIAIRGVDGASQAQKASTWVFPVGENPSVFRQEFMLEMDGEESGENAARFEVLPIMKGQYHGKPLEQTVIVKKKN
ncbi:MAG: OmpA family protein [Candidatus Marinimicrobia bacterium]|nr:OmpA family protein [Candidatus Neomarinimicrobiota bacterium]